MAEEKRVNLKAAKFQKYLDDNKLTFFRRDASNDEADTIVFQSNIQVEGQTLPVIIITDSTIYTIIRVQVGAGLVKEDNHVKFGEYLNGLNRSYKVFKYVVAENGAVFLDACLPSTNESFDPEVVRVVLDVIVDHLNQEYKNIMKEVWNLYIHPYNKQINVSLNLYNIQGDILFTVKRKTLTAVLDF